MSKLIGLLGGAALGAVAMYLLDPDKGSQRRALVKDRATDYAKNSSRVISSAAHTVAEKASSLTRHTAASVDPNLSLADSRILEAVEAALSKAARYPKAIQVSSLDGAVTLAGPILTKEVEAVLKKVRGIKGVTGVDNQMQAHESAEGIDAFHGTAHGNGSNGGSMLSHINGRSVVAGILGLGLTAYALKKRGPIGAMASTMGKAIMTKALHRHEEQPAMMDSSTSSTSTSALVDNPSTQVSASAM